MIDPDTNTARYYLTDHQKSVIATIDSSQATTSGAINAVRYLYEPYGETIRTWLDPNAGTGTTTGSENPNLTPPDTDNNPWRYASGYTQPATGLIKFGTRYYMPSLATWTQRDSESGSVRNPVTLNLYSYAGGNPINTTGRSGRFWDEIADGFGWDAETWYGVSGEVDIWGGVLAAGAASVFLIYTGVGACATFIGCVAGAPLIGAGLFGLYGTYLFGSAAASSFDERW